MSGLSSIVTNPYLILLLICHLLSDYYFQSQKMADRKDQDKKVLGLHILYVALPLIVVSLCHLDLWWICLVILLTHAGIDFLKPIVQKQLKLPTAWTFALDQVLHVSIISCLVLLGAKNGSTYLPLGHFKSNFLCSPSWENQAILPLKFCLPSINPPARRKWIRSLGLVP